MRDPLPCPFCGEEASVSKRLNRSVPPVIFHWVECLGEAGCEAKGPVMTTPDNAVGIWDLVSKRANI